MKKHRKPSLSLLKRAWSLTSLAVIMICFVGYEVAQEYAFPVVVSESQDIKMRACFTPTQNCKERILTRLRTARSEILFMCYAFTDKEIAQALHDASKRGIHVAIVADKTQRDNEKSQIPFLRHAGIPIYIDDHVAISHNKVMIIDNNIIMTGSYNFSVAAQKRNAENLIFIESPEIARQYKRYWQERQQASTLLSTDLRDKAVHKSSSNPVKLGNP